MSDLPRDTAELISAYVDGELPSDARAEVLARAARDPAFARELATMTRLKATLEASVPVPDIALPQRRKRSPGKWAAAAALVLAVLAGAAAWYAGADRDGYQTAGLDWAVSLHRGWDAPVAGRPAAVRLPASLPIAPHVPDLSANGLELAHAAVAEAPDGRHALVVGYLGTRGCRVTMVAMRTGENAQVPETASGTDVLSRRWQVGEINYWVLAEGMSTIRFALVSGSMQRATQNRAPLGAETRMALSRNRAASPPCAA